MDCREESLPHATILVTKGREEKKRGGEFKTERGSGMYQKSPPCFPIVTVGVGEAKTVGLCSLFMLMVIVVGEG